MFLGPIPPSAGEDEGPPEYAFAGGFEGRAELNGSALTFRRVKP